jgi:diguanylate cyclase (GGDEF)-like protein/PAS domain S-box-containing protein
MNDRAKSLRVLFVEDRITDVELLIDKLEQAGYLLDWRIVHTEADYLRALDAPPEIIVSDFRMPSFTGLDALALLQPRNLDIPFILVSGTIGEELAVEAIKLGADDYLLKDRIDRLPSAIESALKARETRVARRSAENQLRETEARLSAFFENSPALMSCKDMDGVYTYVNRQFEVAYGLSPGTAIRKTDFQMFSAETDAGGRAFDLAVLDAGTPIEREVVSRYLDGAHTLLLTKFPIRDSASKTIGTGAIGTDITASKLLDAAYREFSRKTAERERLLSTMLSFISDFAYAFDREGRFLFANKPLLDLWGITLDEAVGRNFVDLNYPAELAAQLQRQIREVFETGQRVTDETPFTSATGVGGYFEYIFSPALGADGAVDFVVGATRDISARKQGEAALKESERFGKSTIDGLTQHLCVVDERGFIIAVNRAWQEFGETNGGIAGCLNLGANYLDACDRATGTDAAAAGEFAAGLRRVLGGENHEFDLEYPCHSPDKQRWFIARVARFHAEDPRRAVITHSDVTERVLARLKLQESESRFRSLTKLSSDWYWEQDADFRFTINSDASLDTSGNDIAPSSVGKTRWDQPHHRLPEEQWRQHRAHLAAHLPFRDFEYPQVVDEKVVRHVSIDGEPIFDAEGRFTGYRGVGRDITERVRRIEDLLRLQTAIDATSDAVFLLDRSTMRLIHVNDAACRLQGQTRAELMASGPVGIVSNSLAELEQAYDEIIAGGVPAKPQEIRRQRSDGSGYWIELRRHPVCLADGWMIVSLIRDITERKDAEAKVQRLNRVYAVLSGINTLIVRVRDRQALFDGACRIAVEHGKFGAAWIGLLDPSTLEVTRVASGGAVSTSLIDGRLSAHAGLPRGQGAVGQSLRSKHAEVVNNISEESAAGNERRLEALRLGYRSLVALPLFMEGEAFGVLVLFARDPEFFNEEELKLLNELAGDISFALDYIGKEEKLNHMAYFDALTGLPNRVLYKDRLAQTLAQAKRNRRAAGVVFIDLDGFKSINDIMGHGVGDELLQQAAVRLKECLRAGDSAARFGGDEFAVILSDLATAQDASLVSQKILNAFARPFELNGGDSYVTASIGIATYPLDSDDIEILIKSADSAMYSAKAAGRNNYQFYTAEMNQRALNKIQLDTRLRRAVERGEFLLHYQPKLDSASGEIVGLEALLRWQPPDSDLVPPAEFVPSLEESGLIVAVGEWIWQEACRQIERWVSAGIEPVPVAINLSARQFQAPGLDDFIRSTLDQYRIHPRLVEVEITESSLVQKPDDAVAVLQNLKQVGIRISIDDFGTGYSNLSYLKRFPLDALKIDRSFVRDVTTDSDDAAIVRAIVTMAHSLNLKVIAEGVETEEQLAFLREIDCEQVQGYLFSKPLSGADCTALLASRTTLRKPAKIVRVIPEPAVLLVEKGVAALARSRRPRHSKSA